MGYPELLRVIEEEAGREGRDARAAAERKAAQILEEARAAASAARDATIARARADAERLVREAEERHGLERERVLLVERRRALEAVKAEALEAARQAGTPALDAALLPEVLAGAVPGALEVIVDPGAEEAARAALARLDPALVARATVRAAGERRGGVAVIAGRLLLDDTLPARVERLWPELEPEVAALLERSG